ncbi:MAG: hypothetical protein AB7U73_06895 [Pirellulales bacterium]
MHLSLSPALEQLITEQAQALGYPSAEDYLLVVFGSDAILGSPQELSDDEFLRELDELASEDNLPSLPADFSRADIYADHD